MSKQREVVLLIDTYRLVNINAYINNILPYLVTKELKIMCPHIHMFNTGTINIDKYYHNYIIDIEQDEREAYNAFIKHLHTMITYTTNKLIGVLNCVYKTKKNYIVLHLQERV